MVVVRRLLGSSELPSSPAGLTGEVGERSAHLREIALMP